MRICPFCGAANSEGFHPVSAVFNGYAASDQTAEVGGCSCDNCKRQWTELVLRGGAVTVYPDEILKAEDL